MEPEAEHQDLPGQDTAAEIVLHSLPVGLVLLQGAAEGAVLLVGSGAVGVENLPDQYISQILQAVGIEVFFIEGENGIL